MSSSEQDPRDKQSISSTLSSLNEWAKQPDLDISVTKSSERDIERESRLRIEEADAAHRRQKDWALSIFGALIFACAMGASVAVLLGVGGASAELKEKAVNVLTTSLGIAAGFVAGRGYQKSKAE